MAKTYVARFTPGQVIRHIGLGYRGIIFDVDATYEQSDEWYELMAVSRPSKHRPWYHILVDGQDHVTYVAEENLVACDEENDFEHPQLSEFFHPLTDGGLSSRQIFN
ncbi:heat shock protein HspQ [Kordiimonas sp. SCSIO 12610]|uniref:heat shock protein HspQ n=1 Tax=Kordiimonas sp. SCSIO 12610 TaxID=2829597 RepID=UPI00210AAF1F|nr:heat shock protein HspQ [Kordiimonas sp. SCSIO 12610]UTW56635.1 heat shock protein HspQ [Kordiimonas sp. SCSIO 12610]